MFTEQSYDKLVFPFTKYIQGRERGRQTKRGEKERGEGREKARKS